MFRNMVTSLLKHEKIQTTDTKAKALRGWVDHVISLAKKGDLHSRRQALSIVREKNVVHKLFAEAADKFGARNGGYTRIIKLGRRPGDAAPVSVMELITSEQISKKKAIKKKEMPGAAPDVAGKEKEAYSAPVEKDEAVTAGITQEKEKTASETPVIEDAGVETAAPLQEEIPAGVVAGTEAVDEEPPKKLPEVEEKTMSDIKNQEEKK